MALAPIALDVDNGVDASADPPIWEENTTVNIIEQFLSDYRSRQEELDAADWTPPAEPEPRQWTANHRIEWRAEAYPPGGDDQTSLRFARHDLGETLRRYVMGWEQGTHALLVRGSAGLGKTHSGVHAAQAAAAEGRRVLWCSARHDSFHDLAGIEGFNDELWYNWLPIHKEDESDPSRVDLIGTTCRYADEQKKWSDRGYRTIDFCTQFCVHDHHIDVCRFRQQAKRKEPIVFARHAHLHTGLSVSNFDVVIVDEWPAQSFIRQKRIPTDHIAVKGAEGAIATLMGTLALMAESNPKHPYSGKALFDEIGPVLKAVYAEIDTQGASAPALAIVPHLLYPGEVEHVPYFYILDFLNLAQAEYKAWQNGWDDWITRIAVGPGPGGQGLHMLTRHEPWDELPYKLIAFDATGTAEFYEPLFRRPFVTYAPDVPRMGRIYQVTGRQNGSGALIEQADIWEGDKLVERGTLTEAGKEELQKVQWLVEKFGIEHTAAICLKGMRSHVEDILGSSNVMHFWGNRGANDFKDKKYLIQIGNPEPNARTVQDLASVLFPQRMEPWPAQGAEYQMVRFAITPELYAEGGEKMPYRRVLMYGDEQLQIVHAQLREMEQYQSLHRARPNVSDCEIWILNSTPSGEQLDGIYDRLPLGPDGIGWDDWFKIEQLLEEKQAAGEAVTVEDVANATGRSQTYIRRQKWLDKICAYKADEWEIERIRPAQGRGGAQKVLTNHKGKS